MPAASDVGFAGDAAVANDVLALPKLREGYALTRSASLYSQGRALLVQNVECRN